MRLSEFVSQLRGMTEGRLGDFALASVGCVTFAFLAIAAFLYGDAPSWGDGGRWYAVAVLGGLSLGCLILALATLARILRDGV